MNFPLKGRARRHRGFTLVELLVAAGITAAMAAMIALMVHNIGSVWTTSAGRVSTDTKARLILDHLELDLQGAIFRDDGNTWFAADVLDRTNNSTFWQPAAVNPKPVGGLSLAMNSASIADARFGAAGVWLRFFTTRRGANDASSAATTAATASAPVAVGYQIIRYFTGSNPTNTNTAYMLYRAEVRPAATGTGSSARLGVLESGYNIRAAPYTTGAGTTNNTGTTTGDPISITRPGSVSARNFDSVLADNVIDFGVRCYVYDSNAAGGLRLVFPAANQNGALTNSNTSRLISSLPSSAAVTPQTFNQVFPDVVDVMVRILTDAGAAQIATIEKQQSPTLVPPLKYNSNAQQWWWGVAQENSRVYTRRIVLNAKSL